MAWERLAGGDSRAATSPTAVIRRTLLAVFAAVCMACTAFAQVGIGDTRDAVLALHGRPTSIAKRGNREIFLYPKGGRIEFVDGKVADVKGPLPSVAAAVPIAAPPAAAEPTPAAAAPADTPVAAAPDAATQQGPAKKEPPAPVPPEDFSTAAAANELAKHVENMDTAWGQAPIEREEHSPLDAIPLFLAGLFLRFGITIGALKLAFKYWEMDAFWKGILTIAGIDLALHATFELLGPATGGFTTMTAVENGIPGLVLIYTINRFCFNKRIQNAVVTAVAVKTVVTFFYIFLAVAALNMAFG